MRVEVDASDCFIYTPYSNEKVPILEFTPWHY